ncbi:MAG: DUF1570 domain-containing protein [Planctomycetota bacterium]
MMGLGSARSLLIIGCLALAGGAWADGSHKTAASPRQRIVAVGTPADTLRVFASRHYHIHTTLTRSETIPFGLHMDAVFDQFQKRFARFQPPPRVAASPTPNPPHTAPSTEAASAPHRLGLMPLYLFRTQQQYLDFLAGHGISGQGTGGIFFVTHQLQGLATWTQGHPRSRTFRTLQHEGFHQFAWHYLGRQLPTWMNEGLAQYFEDAVLLPSGMELGLATPHRINRVRHALRNHHALPLRQLVRYSSREWADTVRHHPADSELLYAQAWSVVFFLIHGDDARYLKSFEVYLRLLAQGKDHDQAFRTAFGHAALRAIEDRWKTHALVQKPHPVNAAARGLEFLGTALLYKHQRGEVMPTGLAPLRRDLQDRGFKITRTLHGESQSLKADDPELYVYARPGGQRSDFLLLEPAGYNLPPRLAAPGLSPEPNLVWLAEPDGRLSFDIEFR